jgi:hypothetical protein
MDTPGKPEKGSWLTNKTFLAFFGALFALLFITLMIVISVATQVEDIDEKLKYIPPQPKGAEISPKSVAAGQMVYVPVYSHIYDPTEDITIASVRYYDTNGNLIKDYLEKPMLLKPLATAEFLVAQKEIEGGSGANFMVKWVSDTKVNEPVIEAVMIGIEGQTSISFVRAGVAIEEK